MFDNSSFGSTGFDSSNDGTIWQNEWIEALWVQLENGTYEGIGIVSVQSSLAETETSLLSDLEAIDNMLLSSSEVKGLLANVQDYTLTTGFNPAIDPLTGSQDALTAAESLARVVKYVHQQGLSDLTATIDEIDLSFVAVPGERGRSQLTISNQGGLRTQSATTLRLYATQQGELDGQAVEIGSVNFDNLSLEPGSSEQADVPFELPNNLAPGEYNIIAVVDADNNIPEANEINNTIAVAQSQTVAWQFGNVGNRTNVELALTDSEGELVYFNMNGNGYGEVVDRAGTRHVVLYDTDNETKVNIQAAGGSNDIGSIVVNGSLERFSAANTNLSGNFEILGSLNKLQLSDTSNASILIGSSNDKEHEVDIYVDVASNLSIVSQSAISLIKADSWTTTEDGTSLISAPKLAFLNVKGDFDTDINIDGFLEKTRITGTASGVWHIGSADRIKVHSTDADWSLSVDSHLDKLYADEDVSGTVTAASLKRMRVRGDLLNANVLIGADLGGDNTVGGGDDTYESGNLERLAIFGDVISSVVGVGLDPVDESLTNGNEQLVPDSVIDRINVRGQVSDNSLFASADFVYRARLGERSISPEEDGRFLTPAKVVTDSDAPVVTLSLQTDTGIAGDAITSVATIVGNVSNQSNLSVLKAGFGDIAIEDYSDISEHIQDGSFTLNAQTLATVLGQPLTDGNYTLSVVAADAFGNTASPVTYKYTLDTTAPTLKLISPLNGGEHSSYVHLVGSVDESATVSAALAGKEETAFTIKSAGDFDQLLRALPLTVGTQQLALTITDAAGNVAQKNIDFSVSESAFITGPTNAKGWAAATADRLILGESDSYVVQATLPVELGQAEGSRTLRFSVDTAFDETDEEATTEDRFVLYLVDSNNPNETLLDNGTANTPIFSLTDEGAEFTPGLVRYDGQYVEIDLTELNEQSEGLLVFQFLNQDTDTSSRVSIDEITNEVDVEGTEGLRFPVDTHLADLGDALNLAKLSTSSTVDALFNNVRFNTETGEYTAELRLRNTGDESISRQVAVLFGDLPDGVELTTLSGTNSDGEGYVNLRNAIRPGGLQPGAISEGVAITFSNPKQLQVALSPQVLVSGPNQAPIFSEIAPLAVMIGQRLEIDLESIDPDGDRVTYSIRGEGDLPKGRLNGSGKLVFEPTPDQVGTYEFTLVATDGSTEATQQLSLTVDPDPDTTTRISGRLLDIEGNPLANLPLTLGRLQVSTDAEGYFTFVVPETSFPTEEIDIEIPFGDPAFDPFFTGTSEINLRRTTFDGATGTSLSNPLRHPNLVSTLMDASMVYGSSTTRAAALRTNDGTGRLKVSNGNLLPINNIEFFPDGTLPNSNRGLTDPATLFATGDVRANENIALTAMHTVFVREHNRLADEISQDDPDLSGEEIYQRARKLIAAQIQHITYSEYLPLLIGDNTIANYAGYDSSVDPSVSHLFSAAAFRIGHTQSFDEFLLIDENGESLPSISLNQSTFNPGLVQQYGLDPILRGLFTQQSEAIDTKVITELRNTLFGPPGSGGIDLAAVDIQRGRDVGLPDYNQARVDFGLAPVTSFAEITSDIEVQAKLEQVYGDVSDIDAIVGGLAEDVQPGAMVGEFFQKVIADQFMRLRDGDRFWYENGQFTAEELSFIRGTSLSALLERNTEMTGLAENLFSTGRTPAALAQGGSVSEQTVTEYAALDGSNNNLENPELGTPGTNLRVDYTQEYGDGIRTLAGQERANVREISNTIFTQTESIPDPTGATGYMLAWSQFMGHDMTFAPAGAADTLKIYGTEFESETGEEFPFVAEKLNLVLGHEVYAGVNNVIERPIYLPALAIDDNAQTVDTDGDITVTNANLGAQVFVDAGSISDNRGNPFEGQLTITEVPRDLTPAVLPRNLRPDLVVTIQPGEMVFETPARITLPNRAGWTPGTIMDLWSINPTTGDFEIVGQSRVTADGESVQTISGGIRNSSWHFVGPPVLNSFLVPEEPCKHHDEEFTSQVNLDTGAIVETHDLVSYQSTGETRGLQLVYDSLRADARPILTARHSIGGVIDDAYVLADIKVDTGSFDYQVAGYEGDSYGLREGEHIWKVGDDRNFQTSLQADLRSISSGRYSYEFSAGAYVFDGTEFSGSSTTLDGELVHVNFIDSVFGSGWGIAGLQELIENEDGSVLLVDGDGTEIVFEQAGQGQLGYQSPQGDFSTLERTLDGAFKRTTKDQTVYRFDTQNRLVSVTDRNLNVTAYKYGSQGLVEIVDPAQLKTTLTYNASGRVASITDPAGRVTQLTYNGSGDLISISDPGSPKRQFEYDGEHRMTAEVDKNGQREKAVYDASGRAVQAIQKDGSNVYVNAVQTQGLYSSEDTIDPLNAPTLRSLGAEFINYIDAKGQESVVSIDRFSGAVNRNDDVRLQRNEDGLVTQRIDGNGNVTRYSYDSNGNLASVSDSLSGSGNPQSDSFDSNSEIGKVIVSDMNNDGQLDIVSSISDQLLLSINGKQRNFLEESIYTAFGSIRDFAVKDINHDDINDIVVVSDRLGILIRNENGSFQQFAIDGYYGSSINLLDLNGDGNIDLLDGSYRAYEGNGRGEFATESIYPENFINTDFRSSELYQLNPGNISAVGDFDEDGDLDVASIDDPGSGSISDISVRTFTNLEGGNWWTDSNEAFSVGQSDYYDLSIGAYDLDSDSDLDLLVLNRWNGDVVVALNNGNGVFSVSTQSSDSLITYTDINGDGVDDIVVSSSQELISVGYRNGGFDYLEAVSFYDITSVNFSTIAAVGDLDGDGDVDIISDGGSGSIYQVFNEGDGQWFSYGEYAEVDEFYSNNDYSTIRLADVNGDGSLDALVASRNYGSNVDVYFNRGDGLFNAPQTYNTDWSISDFEVADIDRDGNLDIVLAGSSGIAVMLGNGAGSFSLPESQSSDDTPTYTDIALSFLDDGPVIDVAGAQYSYDENFRRVDSLSIGFDLSPSGIDQQTNSTITSLEGRGRKDYQFDETFGQLLSILDERGQKTLYELDAFGNRTAEIKVVGERDSIENGESDDIITGYSYTQGGLIDEITSPQGDVTKHEYDSYGRLTKLTYDFGTDSEQTELYRFNEGNFTGLADEVVDSEGVTSTYVYDKQNRVVSVSIAELDTVSTTAYEYDGMGNVVREADGNGEQLTTYDAKGRVTQVVNRDGSTSEYKYDGNGNRTEVYEDGDLVEKNSYNEQGLVSSTTNQFGRTTNYKYDANDLLIEEDNSTDIITYIRDARGQTIEKTIEEIASDQASAALSSDGASTSRSSQKDGSQFSSERYITDATGKLLSKVDSSGQLIKFSYDESTYQPTKIDFTSDGTEVGLTYKEFEKDKKTTHKPLKISGDFGELSLSYTKDGSLKAFSDSVDKALMDVFAAALGAGSHNELVDMLSYKGKEIEEPDPCVKKSDDEKIEEDRTAPPEKVMDAWARLSVIAINTNRELLDSLESQQEEILGFQQRLLESVSQTSHFSSHSEEVELLSVLSNIGFAYGALASRKQNQNNGESKLFLDQLWLTRSATDEGDGVNKVQSFLDLFDSIDVAVTSLEYNSKQFKALGMIDSVDKAVVGDIQLLSALAVIGGQYANQLNENDVPEQDHFYAQLWSATDRQELINAADALSDFISSELPESYPEDVLDSEIFFKLILRNRSEGLDNPSKVRRKVDCPPDYDLGAFRLGGSYPDIGEWVGSEKEIDGEYVFNFNVEDYSIDSLSQKIGYDGTPNTQDFSVEDILTVGSKNALVASPYYFEFSRTAGDFTTGGEDITAEESDEIRNILLANGFDTDFIVNENPLGSAEGNSITIEDYIGGIGEPYGVFSFVSHGSFLQESSQGSTAQNKNYSERELWRKPVMHTGILTTIENVIENNSYIISGGLEVVSTIFGNNFEYAITDEFVKESMSDFASNSVIYLGGCNVLEDGELASAFLEKGAGAVYGYTRTVGSRFAYLHGLSTFTGLSTGLTTGYAPGLNNLEEDIQPDKCYETQFIMYGNRDISFYQQDDYSFFSDE